MRASKKKSPPRAASKKKTSGRWSWWRWVLATGLLCLSALAVYLIYLQADVTRRFNGTRFTEPAAVYARPLIIEEGQALSVEDLLLELQLLGYRQQSVATEAGEFAQTGQSFSVRARAFVFADEVVPERSLYIALRDGFVQQLRQQQKEIERLQLDPVLLGRFSPAAAEDRELIQLNQLPSSFVPTLLAVEDRDFYQHFGFSVRGMLRALWQNLRAGEVEQGGSTITQQLVKNYFLNQRQNILRKLNELLMAVILEWNYSKDEILQSYLNEVYFGQDGDRAIHGVGLASRYFFGKPIAELNTAEVALLVGLIKGPSVYSPWKHADKAQQRRDLVLQILQSQLLLSAEEKHYWQAQPLGVLQRPRALSGRMPAVLDLVKRELQQHQLGSDTGASGWRIFTSIDPVLQRKTEVVIEKSLQRLDPEAQLQAAAVISDRKTGAIRAIVGGRNSAYAGFNRALDAKRPVGSLLKPFIYYSALLQPTKFSLATPLQDSAFVMRADDGRTWQPKNYDGGQHGNVSLQTALSKSLNLATARLAMEVGLHTLEQQLQRFGLQRDITLFPSLALGALELSPLQVNALYSGFANGRAALKPHAILVVSGPAQQALTIKTASVTPLQPESIFLTNFVLQDVVRQGTGKSLGERFPELGLAGKTGTTNDKRDSWFAGFDDEHLAVIWLGRDDNGATEFSGASGAMQVFSDLIAVKPQRPLSLQMPKGIRFAWVSAETGEVLPENCNDAQWLPVRSDAPVGSCERRD